MRDRERERERQRHRGRSRLHAGSLMWDSIPGPQGSRPELKADAQPLSHSGVPPSGILSGGQQRREIRLKRSMDVASVQWNEK